MSDNPFELGDQMLVMGAHEQAIRNRIGAMDEAGYSDRFWTKDGRLWLRDQNDPAITGTMGWIDVARTMKGRIPELTDFADEIKAAGFERAVLAGMGGSSLAPLVLSEVFYEKGKGIPVEVLDSTDPATVLRIQRGGPLDKTLFIISSKSGTTAEPNAFFEYFYDQVSKLKSSPGENFVAITDPGTLMEQKAKGSGFRKIFLNFEDIGGRFSALSYFGMVPAALLGIDLDKLLDRAIEVTDENMGKPTSECPAFTLGTAIGTLSTLGVNKLTFWLSNFYASFGLWLEQLVAESTGKEGKGLLPVAGEEPGTPSEYGSDRIFAYLRPAGEDCTYLDARIAPLRDKGCPVIQIDMRDKYDIAREMMRWELATATSGAIMEIDPFDQPNVQESKDVTKRLIAQVEEQGSLPVIKPDREADGLQFYGPVNGNSAEDCICGYLAEGKTGDFFTLMAYVTETQEMTEALSRLQRHIRDATCLATTKGYGPRFLHSTGQFHKGGPNEGHFIQLTQDDKEDAQLPGRRYTFGTFRNAQALGDKETLEKHGRQVIRIHLGLNPVEGVNKLVRAVEQRPTVAHA